MQNPQPALSDGRGAPASRPALRTRLRYHLDLALSRGGVAVIGYLAIIMVIVIVVAAAVLAGFRLSGVNGGPRLGYPEAFWQSMLRVLGKGSFASDQRWPTRLVNLAVTIIGIFLAGALIGLIATALNQRINNLRKGRSPVLEHGHTLVLGWSPRLPVILSELAIANADQRHAGFVVLADRPKTDMEDELRRRVPDTMTTRVICRTGDPGKLADLELVNIRGARSVIVLAGEEGDAGAVKAVLAVRNMDLTFTDTRLVAELRSINHARTLRRLTDHKIATVHADQVISQVTAQACHQSGLAEVFRELLGFAGDDIYFRAIPELTGRTYGEVLQAFETSSVLGVCRAGQVTLNPPPDFVFVAGDEVIAISPGDNRVAFSGFVEAPAIEVRTDIAFIEPSQRIALIGWSTLGAGVLRELDRFLGVGSVIDVLVNGHHFAATDVVVPVLERSTVNVRILRHGPESLLDVLAEHDYDQAIVLGYRHYRSAGDADASTMLTLLAMHHAYAGRPRRPRVIAEMLDRSNVEIAQTTGVDDFIVSDELSSLMLAQVSERFELQAVFHELFDPDGCFISLHPASLYAPARPVPFAALVAAAAAEGQTALGYQVKSGPVVLNPHKSAIVQLGVDDHVLVLGPRRERPAQVATKRSGASIGRPARAMSPRVRSRAARESRRRHHSSYPA